MPEEDPIKLWQHLHGASIHFPIALVLVAFVFDLGALIFKRSDWRTVGFWALIVASLIAILAIGSGLAQQLDWFGAGKWDAARLLPHRNFALAGCALALLVAIVRVARRDGLEGPGRAAIVALEAVAAGLIGWAGYLGAYVGRGY